MYFFVQSGGLLSGNAKLTLIVDGTLSVYGGAAGDGEDTKANVPGHGGHSGSAGIEVPVGTVLTVIGNGTLSAYGGDAGSGGNAGTSTNMGAGGGGGAGAGIGGSGAAGGNGGNSSRNGGDGGTGASMGTVNIWNTVTVNAYGGGGGSGSWCNGFGGSGGDDGGAGGYPAAGVGGGGGGGGAADWDNPGGGFTGGRGETNGNPTYVNKNGEGSGNAIYGIAGGYFRADYVTQKPTNLYTIAQGIGGMSTVFVSGVKGGNGGVAGSGGTVTVSETATFHAYNGSHITTIPQNYGNDPTPIYAQSGYDLALLRTAGVTKVDARTKSALESELGSKGKSSSITPAGLPGVGSGAGFTETSHWIPGASFLLLKSNIDAGSSQ